MGFLFARLSGLPNNLFMIMQAAAEQHYSVHAMLVDFRCKL